MTAAIANPDFNWIAKPFGSWIVADSEAPIPRVQACPPGYTWIVPAIGFAIVYPPGWRWPNEVVIVPKSMTLSSTTMAQLLPGYTVNNPDPANAAARLDYERAQREAARIAADTPEARAANAALPHTEPAQHGVDTSREGQYAADEATAKTVLDALASMIAPAIVEKVLTLTPTVADEKRTASKPADLADALLAALLPELESFPPNGVNSAYGVGNGAPLNLLNAASFARNFPTVSYQNATVLYWAARSAVGAQETDRKLKDALHAKSGVPSTNADAVKWLCSKHKLAGSKPAYDDGRTLSASSPEVQAYLNSDWGWQDYGGKAILNFGGFPERVPLAEQGFDTEDMVGSITTKAGAVLGTFFGGGSAGGMGGAHDATVKSATARVRSDMIAARDAWCAASGIPIPVNLMSAAGIWAILKKIAIPAALVAGAGLAIYLATRKAKA